MPSRWPTRAPAPKLVLVSRTKEKLNEVKAAVEAAGGRAHIVRADVSKTGEIRAIEQEASRLLKSAAKDRALILVNCAGFGFTKPALDTTEEDWDGLLDTHLKGTFFCCQALARLMIERGYGKIINLSSTWSASTDTGKSVYGAAKAGVSYLTAALSTEWAPLGVRVNAIAPTSTLTENTARSFRENEVRAAAPAEQNQARPLRRAVRPRRRSHFPREPRLRLHHRPHALRRRRLARRIVTAAKIEATGYS